MNQTDRQIAALVRVLGWAFVLFTALGIAIALGGCSPAPDRPGDDYQPPTYDHHPDTIRYLIGPAGFEVWEFRTADGTRCMLAQHQETMAASARALSCQWRPSPDY